ncbi:MAG: thiamine diphosphokinase [Alphaproteobacteria bacterium]|nr:thiamine diphosphokinase [Alphaproteobacteria bacterium]NNF24010.1 thiamine diphosphokinase [Paracoccaceae bacterium]
MVETDQKVTLLGPVKVKAHDLDDILTLAPFVVAADGGAAQALDKGLIPKAVLGDLDSLPQSARAALPPEIVFQIDEQDSTDFEKCLARIEAPMILCLGFAGGRIDHELAVYSALVKHPQTKCIVVGDHDIVFAAPPDMSLDLPVGARVSLFPMRRVQGASRGLRWPIAGLGFAPDRKIGTSNEATGAVNLQFERPGMLVILARDHLAAAMAALSLSPRWPASSPD